MVVLPKVEGKKQVVVKMMELGLGQVAQEEVEAGPEMQVVARLGKPEKGFVEAVVNHQEELAFPFPY